ncbi:patatin-like phospholipase family protein [Lutibaculum baratangense]|uniref:PNPLA domain-containing protein n=1 Tax=Lutibaculum baratangense AMV1 TaxID=631454 RepID=V4QZ06_9HYPH|nr:patatin-like phospholipase family protein [Lutibaculum baratangense]ESR24962.1 hypothetical protein N177_2285 [Lutibaculum baratangense AMV1]
MPELVEQPPETLERHLTSTSEPRIGLALSAGGARGLAHVQALAAFDELGLKPHRIAGTSMGAVVGAAYAAGLSAREIRQHMVEVFKDRREVFARLWRARSGRFGDLMTPNLTNRAQANPERLLHAFLPHAVDGRIEDTKIPLAIVASDFYGWHEVALTAGPLRRAIAASIAIPMVLKPVIVDKRVMVDGGACNPLPVEIAAQGADFVVAVDVINGPHGPGGKIPTAYETAFGASQLMMQSIVKAKMASRPPDILIRPEIAPYRVLDFLKAREILESTEATKERLKREIDRLMVKSQA